MAENIRNFKGLGNSKRKYLKIGSLKTKQNWAFDSGK